MAGHLSSNASAPNGSKLEFVNIMIGTGGHGHTYPGATVPFGMVQLSPDTYNRGWDWCSGYHYSDSSIMGFSHTHLSGTGIGDMLDILVMPCTGTVKTIVGSRDHPDEGYRSRFSHDDEKATPGYYSVVLRDYKIRAELTATDRAGIHRYIFPSDQTSHIILDLDHGYDDGPGVVRWAKLKVIGNDTIVGGRSTARWANGREIYFAMKFSRPFDNLEVLVDGKKEDDISKEVDGKSLKCVLHYPTKNDEIILVKTGISGVAPKARCAILKQRFRHGTSIASRHTHRSAGTRSFRRSRSRAAHLNRKRSSIRLFITLFSHRPSLTMWMETTAGWTEQCISFHRVSTTTAPSRCGIPTVRSIHCLRLCSRTESQALRIA